MANEESQIGFSNQTINSCFMNYYIVPDYQREYVWEDKDVEQLLSDLSEAYSGNSNKEYFVGSIVTYKSDTKFELIDGQQRLTTFFLLLCALKKQYDDNGEPSDAINKLILSSRLDSNGDTLNDYHLLLQYAEARGYLEAIANKNSMPSNLTQSGERLVSAYNTIEKKLSEIAGKDFSDLKKFASFLLYKIRFIQIETHDIADALVIFETINQRGVGLNSMDLLKNMIFRQVDREQFKELNLKWKEIITTLESIKEKPLRFLRYFIMSNYDTSDAKDSIIREEQIYSWLSKNDGQCGYEKQPFEFVEKMKLNVEKYKEFLKPVDNEQGNNHLKNVTLFAGAAYKMHIMLLLAAYNMDKEALTEFKKTIESIVYYASLCRIGNNIIERTFTSWCSEIRKIKTISEYNDFKKNTIIPDVSPWKQDAKIRFMNLSLNNIQQYRIKFILGRISNYLDQLKSSVKDAEALTNYLSKAYEVEHIMPQTCDNTVERYGMERAEYDIEKQKIGNLTLLEKSANASIHNDSYEDKIKVYKEHSSVYLTKTIAGFENLGNSAITKTNNKLKTWDKWNKDSIEQRQEMLFELSEEIWGLE